MLYTDSDLLVPQDLVDLDPEANDVAAAEGIDLANAISQAWADCADEITSRMDAFGGGTLLSTDPASYLNAWGGAMGTAQSRVALAQIVASSPYADKLSLIQNWLVSRALGMFYRQAGRRTTSDRYTAKAEDFMAEAKTAWLRLAIAGLPIVAQPLPCPGSAHVRGAAGALAVTAVSGGAAASPVSYDVAITYMAADNTESAPSAIATLTVGASQVLRADISSLAWPTSLPLTAGRTLSLRTPAGWLLYVGAAGSGVLYRQTLVGLPIATKTYTLTGAPALSGIMLGAGQVADYNLAFHQTLQRA